MLAMKLSVNLKQFVVVSTTCCFWRMAWYDCVNNSTHYLWRSSSLLYSCSSTLFLPHAADALHGSCYSFYFPWTCPNTTCQLESLSQSRCVSDTCGTMFISLIQYQSSLLNTERCYTLGTTNCALDPCCSSKSSTYGCGKSESRRSFIYSSSFLLSQCRGSLAWTYRLSHATQTCALQTQHRALIVWYENARNSIFVLTTTAPLADACQCTSTGLSGGVQTGVVGCTRDSVFPTGIADRDMYCFINGGASAKCPCSFNSTAYPGAAYIFCANST